MDFVKNLIPLLPIEFLPKNNYFDYLKLMFLGC